MSAERRVQVFGALVVACVFVAVVVIVAAAGSDKTSASRESGDALLDARRERQPRVLFRNLDRARPRTFGQIAVSPLSVTRSRTLVSMKCERVYFRGGSGICLARGSSFAAGYRARVFGTDLTTRGQVAVDGIPSRVRVSPDGELGSVTLFVAGHSYAEVGGFSTTTTLIDLARGTKIAQLEDFATSRDGRRITAPDVNYWGVTFARNHDRFYATLATGRTFYLVEGSVSARTMRTIHRNVECPSLSPDETRIAYKKRVGPDGKRWRLYVLDLKTMRETPLAETRSVDDQVEWLDDDHVLYGLEEAVWILAADGTGNPRRYADQADSPTVVRW
jgi:hypothetical protein